MIEYSDALIEDLRDAASAAELGPADLADIVTRRYLHRRQRRMWIAGSVAGVVVALVVVVTLTVPRHTGGRPGPIGDTPLPTAEPTAPFIPLGPGPWHLPAAGTDVPSLASAWPNAVVHLPATAPDGGAVHALAAIDATHVLVESSPASEASGSFYSYDIPGGTFRLITTIAQNGTRAYVNRLAVSPHWVVWDVDQPATPGYQVFKAPLSGGPGQLVATLPEPITYTGSWFATDSDLYWSGTHPGVLRLPLSGGTPTPVPGFADMYVINDTSPWAVSMPGVDITQRGGIGGGVQTGVTRRLKNLVTGAQIDVSVPHGTTGLQCSAAFCVGTTGSGVSSATEFIQRPDGTARQTIHHGPMTFDVRPVGDGGILVVTLESGDESGSSLEWMICDPVEGRAGGVALISHGTLGLDDRPDLLGWPSKAGSSGVDNYFITANAHP